jgi:ABC-2 type transport system permease protein
LCRSWTGFPEAYRERSAGLKIDVICNLLHLKKLLAIVQKEIYLIIRDIPALVTLFVMPVILLIVITLSQESAMVKDNSGMKIILVNKDSSALGDTIINSIIRSGSFSTTRSYTEKEARIVVAEGKFQMAVIIPEHSTEKLLDLLNKNIDSIHPINEQIADISFVFDPGLQSIYKETVTGPLKELIRMAALKILVTGYGDILRKASVKELTDIERAFSSKEFRDKIPDFPYREDVIKSFREEIMSRMRQRNQNNTSGNPVFLSEFLKINEETAIGKNVSFRPNPLQNNVPAFTLFAMFFIVIPLAGSILGEKGMGVYDRMRTLPVRYLTIISAKTFVYLIICILQFIVLICVGVYLMPLLSNLQPIDMNVSYPALITAVIACGLAAAGFGILIGTLSETLVFAATFGSVMVVILAMLGGIFVPVHMLPDSLKSISWISPLRWGTDAFLGVFARSGGIRSVWIELVLLFMFFSVSLVISVKIFDRKR